MDVDSVDDPFGDLLGGSYIPKINGRAGAKFQPKSKPKASAQNVSDGKKKNAPTTTTTSTATCALRPCSSTTDSELGDTHNVMTTSKSGFLLSDDMGYTRALCLEEAADKRRSVEETVNLFKELTCIEDFHLQSRTTTGTCSETAGRKLDMDNGQSAREAEQVCPNAGMFDAISEDVPNYVKSTDNSQSQFWDQIKNEFVKDIMLPDAWVSVSYSPEAQLISLESGKLETGTIPAFAYDDMLNLSNCNSIPAGPSSELPVLGEHRQFAAASYSDIVIPDDEVVASDTTPEMSGRVSCKRSKRKMSATEEEEVWEINSGEFEELSQGIHGEIPLSEDNEQNESSYSLRPRKRVATHVLGDRIDNGSQENGGPTSDPCNNSVMEEENDNDNDDNDDEYRGEDTSREKKAPRRSKKVMAENERPVQKHKKSKKSPQKFSHSTRRNSRRVDKVLLQTPYDEINPQEIPIKDLIRLAEAKERILNKEASTLKQSLPNESVDNFFHHVEDTDAPNQGLTNDDGQAVRRDPLEYFNYQTFMKKTPSKRWCKKDTELFYEALQQFKMNYAMLQLLFPDRTTRQLKLKFKKEERRHRTRIDDALKNHSKNHSLFKLLIEQMQQATAQERMDANKDVESISMTDEEAAAENSEVTSSGWKQEVEVTKDSEANGVREPGLQTPSVESHEVGDYGDGDGDDIYRWSQYKSEF